MKVRHKSSLGKESLRLAVLTLSLLITAPLINAAGLNLPASYTGDDYELFYGTPPGELTDKQVKKIIWHMVFKDRNLLKEKINAALNGYLDNPDSVIIDLFPEEPAKLLGGAFKEITVEMRGSEVDSLRVSFAFLRLKECILNFDDLIREKKFSFRDEGSNDFLIQVSEEDLNNVFKAKSDNLRISQPKLDLRPGHVRFSGGIHILFFNEKVRVDGQFTARNDSELHFNPKWMNVGIMPLPGFVLSKIRKSINPIATLEDFKFKIKMDTVRVTNKSFIIASTAMRDMVAKLSEKDELNANER
jgi:hypothetical protein